MSIEIPYAIGYYVNPGAKFSTASRVHIVETNRGPICGAKPTSEFQWCAFIETITPHEYVTCEKCKGIARSHHNARESYRLYIERKQARREGKRQKAITVTLTPKQADHLISVAVAALAGPFGEGDTEGLDSEVMKQAVVKLQSKREGH